MTDKPRHNPTPEERDEKFSLYGMDPEKVAEALLQPDTKEDTRPPKPKRRRKKP